MQLWQEGHRPQLTKFRWNSQNQLIGVQTPGGQQWDYRYDAFGRRMEKVCERAGLRTTYLWDGDVPAEIREYRHNRLYSIRHLVFDGWQLLVQQVQFFSLNPENRHELIAGKVQTQYAVCAPTGEPLALFDEAGHRVWRQPPQSLYGLRLGVLGENAELNPGLKFAGQWLDEESGLVYNRFRYYSPVAGQYLTPDPIGLLGGENLYSYVGNPTGFIDPLGLSGLDIIRNMVRKVKGRLPINSKYAGQVYPASELPVAIRNKYPHGVPFTKTGFPDFSRYSIKNVRIELGKNRTIDFARADAAVGYSRSNPRPTGYTWHHHHDSGYMQLIPTDIHSKVKHTGGVATRKCPKGK